MAALVSAFTLSSCLGESEGYEYPKYEALVTVGPEAKKLYSDGGQILKPVNTITGLDKVERAVIAFNLIPSELNGSTLEAGKTYDVELDANYTYKIPTNQVVDLHDNAVAADTLINTQQPIVNVSEFYVKNGYLTAALAFTASQFSPYYVNLAFDSQKDVDLATNTITFTLYYDCKSTLSNSQVNFPFSFRLPSELFFKFPDVSTINVVLKYMVGLGGDTKELTSTMKPEDFYLSSF
ncbi:MAG: hypothetical protein IKW37_00070 [Bacteroidaceae bacterium]|nr:hypothetical protein [Bacteroidaceae bacterium]